MISKGLNALVAKKFSKENLVIQYAFTVKSKIKIMPKNRIEAHHINFETILKDNFLPDKCIIHAL